MRALGPVLPAAARRGCGAGANGAANGLASIFRGTSAAARAGALAPDALPVDPV
ncbi:hypothetical protein M2167_000745 [Streptomyces sp. SPB4]|nr:hypothetical protein [Streptomyces sp. SPB4]